MASYWSRPHETTVEVPSTEECNMITFYKIIVKVGDVEWTVSHRYSEFFDMHSHLIADHGVAKDSLPPKKVIRNKCPLFIEARRKALEEYLQYVLGYLKITMPWVFTEFLHFHLYDTFYLLQSLSAHFYKEDETILSISKQYKFTPLELHAISECFHNPHPQVEVQESCYDLCHALDFCSQLKKLIIKGKATRHLTSNIVPNMLPFKLSPFKSLEVLVVTDYNMEHIDCLGNLRNTIKSLMVLETKISTISQVLQCDIIHKTSIDESQTWSSITNIDLTGNAITTIDETIKLVPNVETLILNGNKITNIENLSSLTKLRCVSICENLITTCTDLHTKLGNIQSLNLSQNFITSLEGFSKLYSLEVLDLSMNKICDVEQVVCLGDLPCLNRLMLTGNPVSTTIDYRVKVLEVFDDKAKDIYLDNEKPSQQEVDKVLVLRALRIVKEGRTPDLVNPSYIS